MTPEELKSARHALGLSANGLAKFVHLSDGAHVRKIENGSRPISGPLEVLMEAIMASSDVRRHFGLSLPDDPASKSEQSMRD
ncbi:helix-turn-helix transcriptional regulator [Rhizobium sp. BK602]|uniref:helix-turn-helix domain-containing protein n=1 Tax=Rhizobium sp. BK602 TaxID=2586986 RepID=UPI001618D93E|nr:helix-turn-helix transcriptional regulator [Rhizobium sp. BK602]MBB3608689.1 DNA-binding transcriptional regulator YiaG [Rhizobium sp. BK602]